MNSQNLIFQRNSYIFFRYILNSGKFNGIIDFVLSEKKSGDAF